MLRVALVSIVMVCGNGAAGAGYHRLCHMRGGTSVQHVAGLAVHTDGFLVAG